LFFPECAISHVFPAEFTANYEQHILRENMVGSTFWGKHMIGSAFWKKNMISSTFEGKNMTSSTY
jgi:hypothetical protein